MLPRLEARLEPSNVMRYASPLLAVALTIVGGIAVFAALGKNPLDGLRIFFVSPLKDVYGMAELLLKATPLMLIAVGLAVGFRANVWNIGAEGQYILGAVAGGGVALPQTRQALADGSAPRATRRTVLAAHCRRG